MRCQYTGKSMLTSQAYLLARTLIGLIGGYYLRQYLLKQPILLQCLFASSGKEACAGLWTLNNGITCTQPFTLYVFKYISNEEVILFYCTGTRCVGYLPQYAMPNLCDPSVVATLWLVCSMEFDYIHYIYSTASLYCMWTNRNVDRKLVDIIFSILSKSFA